MKKSVLSNRFSGYVTRIKVTNLNAALDLLSIRCKLHRVTLKTDWIKGFLANNSVRKGPKLANFPKMF